MAPRERASFSTAGAPTTPNKPQPTEDGWVVTGTILGDFISIRKPYDWGEGDYTVRIAHDGSADDADGRWYGMWITDPEGDETHMGSLKFPMVNGSPPMINPRHDVYSSMLVISGWLRDQTPGNTGV